MTEEELDVLRKTAARVPALERSVHRHKAAAQELERLVEDRTRELYLAIEKIKRQARLVGARTAIALLGEHGSLLRAAPHMLRAFGEELSWDSLHLWMYEVGQDSLVCRAQWHAPGPLLDAFHGRTLETVFVRGHGLPGRVLETGIAAWITIADDPNFPRAAEAREAGLQTGCAFPILVDGGVHAVIEMFSTQPRDEDEDLVLTLTALGSQIGQVIERERAKQDLRSKELQIAKRIQTAILPRELVVEGLQIAAGMVPADEVGGDYYDVLPFTGGAWLAIGDVTGHGVAAGMIMIMVQSAVAALTSERADSSPREVVVALNQVIHDTIRRRMRADDHVTFALLRYRANGELTFAGGHEELIVWRRATGRCEVIATTGTWLGAVPSIDKATVDDTLTLHPGDLLVLYTDGVIEARDVHRRQYGIGRLCTLVERTAHDATAPEVYDAIIRDVLAWGPQDDDVSLVIARKL